MCLSLISTPCDSYTFSTSPTMYTSVRPGSLSLSSSSSVGLSEPSVSGSPAPTISPSVTIRRVRRGIGYSRFSGSGSSAVASGQTTIVVDRSPSTRSTRPAISDEDRRALRVARLEQLDDARQAVRDVGAGDAALVERPHRELGARLADRLRRDDADGVADLARGAGGQAVAVAAPAHADVALAAEHRAHAHERRSVRGVGPLRHELTEVLAREYSPDVDRRVRRRSSTPLGQDTADERPVRAVDPEDLRLDPVLGAAVLLADDHVLRHVDQAPGEVARVGGAQRRVGEALAGAVGRDEVLEDRQALHEVRLDRALDDLALRIGHETAHARQLADLLEASAGAGRRHHEDGVRLPHLLHHLVGDVLGRATPDLDDLLLALALGDQALLPEVVDLLDLQLEAGEDLALAAEA